jgi:hypothetical protein
VLTLVHAQASVNGEPVMLDAAPFIADEMVYLPLRFISEALGKTVGYLPAGSYSGQDAAAGLANPLVWVEEAHKMNGENAEGEILIWLKEQMQEGLDTLKANLTTAHRGFLTEPYYSMEQIDSALTQIQAGIDAAVYIKQVGRYAMFKGPYTVFIDYKAKSIYFYTTAHSLETVWKADMNDPDTFVPMYR